MLLPDLGLWAPQSLLGMSLPILPTWPLLSQTFAVPLDKVDPLLLVPETLPTQL